MYCTVVVFAQGPQAYCLINYLLNKLKARAGIIFRNCEKSNDENPRTGDKSAIKNK